MRQAAPVEEVAMKSKPFVTPVLSLAFLLALLPGCGIRSSANPGAGGDTFISLRAIRTSGFPQNHVPPFDHTTGDTAKIMQLYEAMLALPPFPSGTINCPNDLGVAYHLTFVRADEATATVLVNATGCQSVVFSPQHDIRANFDSDAFWRLFADTFDVPQSALDLRGDPNGPIALTPAP
jgi:hypothetical protein